MATTIAQQVRTKFIKSAISVSKRGKFASPEAKRIHIENVADTLILCYEGRNANGYHNLNHIYNVMDTLEDLLAGSWANLRGLLGLKDDAAIAYSLRCLVVATLYHDSVDDGGGLDPAGDVIQAAENFDEDFDGMVSVGTKSIIRESILATVNHQPRDYGSILHSAVFCDADLWVLGGCEDVYRAYRRGIENEYMGIEEGAYVAGRTRLLKDFLNRPTIYSTWPVIVAREQKARDNISSEIESLLSTGRLK